MKLPLSTPGYGTYWTIFRNHLYYRAGERKLVKMDLSIRNIA